jgi:hypothetical protein
MLRRRLKRRRRSEMATTETLENAIAAPASVRSDVPAIASVSRRHGQPR